METEWKVWCLNGHRFYERVRGLLSGDFEFTDCPRCGAPRRANLLDPITVRFDPPLEYIEVTFSKEDFGEH